MGKFREKYKSSPLNIAVLFVWVVSLFEISTSTHEMAWNYVVILFLIFLSIIVLGIDLAMQLVMSNRNKLVYIQSILVAVVAIYILFIY